MIPTIGWILLAVAATVVVAALAAAAGRAWWRRRQEALHEAQLQAARAEFRRQREWLEARFFTLASESGRPRGLAWVDCDFENDVAFALDKSTGELRALVAVNISFAAIEGGGLEDNPNVGRVRAATALFLHRNNQWQTDGRAIMNKNPQQAIEFFHQELETAD